MLITEEKYGMNLMGDEVNNDSKLNLIAMKICLKTVK